MGWVGIKYERLPNFVISVVGLHTKNVTVKFGFEVKG